MKSLFKSTKVIISAVIILLILGAILTGVIASSTANGRKVKEKLVLGEKYLTELNYEEAIITFKEVIEIEPRNVDAYLGIASAYVGLNQPDEAVVWLEQGIKAIEDEGEVIENCEQLYIKTSKIHKETGNKEKAVDVLERGYKFTLLELFKELIEQLIKQVDNVNTNDNSDITTEASEIEENVKDFSNVDASIPSGNYGAKQLIVLISDSKKIYYTLDGSEPTKESPIFLEPIEIANGDTILKVVAENEFEELGEIKVYAYSVLQEEVIVVDNELIPPPKPIEMTIQNSDTEPTREATPIPETTSEPEEQPRENVTPTLKVKLTPIPTITSVPTPTEIISLKPVMVSESDFTFTVKEGNATIEKYVGKGGNIIIPGVLGGGTVTNIKSRAFYGCTSLQVLTIPKTVISCGTATFGGCTNLKKVIFEDGTTTIPIEAIRNCESLEEVVIPKSVTSISRFAFNGCINLKEINLNEGIVKIEDYAFANCVKLTSITIPSTVTSIGSYAFTRCTALKTVIFIGAKPKIGSNAFPSELNIN